VVGGDGCPPLEGGGDVLVGGVGFDCGDGAFCCRRRSLRFRGFERFGAGVGGATGWGPFAVTGWGAATAPVWGSGRWRVDRRCRRRARCFLCAGAVTRSGLGGFTTTPAGRGPESSPDPSRTSSATPSRAPTAAAGRTIGRWLRRGGL
jgi:hypothetical protein